MKTSEIKQKILALQGQKQTLEKQIEYWEQEYQNALKNSPLLSKDERVELFYTLFVCRSDKFVKQNQNSNFYPVTRTFQGSDYIPLDKSTVESHLRGNSFLGVYGIDEDNKVQYATITTQEKNLQALFLTLQSMKISGYCEKIAPLRYRVWIFFQQKVEVNIAQSFIIEVLSFSKITGTVFPNSQSAYQDIQQIVSLPMHLKLRQEGFGIWYDAQSLQAFENQWELLQGIHKCPLQIVQSIASKQQKTVPWKEHNQKQHIHSPLKLDLVLFDWIYIPKHQCEKSFIQHLRTFCRFDNPQVKTLQRLRKPLYNIPRIIKGYEEDELYIKLPRGFLKQLLDFFKKQNIVYTLEDKRVIQKQELWSVVYQLKHEQKQCIDKLSQYNSGICVAPPGFGKTLIGAKMIELRACSTLVLVNKNMLLDQWRQRFEEYFDISKKEIGYLGKGKNRLNHKLDVATMQSLKNSPELIKNYSFVIVDECHHIPAVTFESIVKQFCGKYILGLSATPSRKDEMEPLLFWQLGDVLYQYKKPKVFTNTLRLMQSEFESSEQSYSQILAQLIQDSARNTMIIEQVKANRQRNILVLSDRIEHIEILHSMLTAQNIDSLVVHGSQHKRLQNHNLHQVKDASLILATSSFFGEGVDFPHLDTIVFATPISYYGRLIQYLGRIGRDGSDTLAIDILDSKVPMLQSAFEKRKRGYQELHYQF